MLAYPYTLPPPDDNGTLEALDGLLCALEGYFADRRAVPLPSAAAAECL